MPILMIIGSFVDLISLQAKNFANLYWNFAVSSTDLGTLINRQGRTPIF